MDEAHFVLIIILLYYLYGLNKLTHRPFTEFDRMSYI